MGVNVRRRETERENEQERVGGDMCIGPTKPFAQYVRGCICMYDLGPRSRMLASNF